ncbi:unnamed protein product [Boreogadus saida]
MRVYVYGNETTKKTKQEKNREAQTVPLQDKHGHLFIKHHLPSSQAWAKLLDDFSRRDNSPSTEVTSRVSFSFGFPRSVSTSDPFLQEEVSSRTLNLI